MTDVEEYFPRGGKKPVFKEFKQNSNFLGQAERVDKKKKKTKSKKKAEGDDGYLSDEFNAEFEQSTKNCAVGISYQTVKEGVLLLGRVVQVLETKVYISLPCRMTGTVMACHISDAYNKLLEAYVNDQIDSVRELARMFRPGQYVAVRVLENNKHSLLLSVMPQHVNKGKNHSELQKGALLQAAVTSVEDHGYVMDIGIPNVRAFLPKKNCNEEIELDTGVVTWCKVKQVSPSAEDSIVTLSNQLAALQQPLRRKPNAGGSALFPGTAVEFVVDKALENGIEGRMFDDITAYVQRQHTDKVKGKKPTLGQRVYAHFLYELPTRKTLFLTLRNIFESTYPDLEAEQKFKQGDIVPNAQVIKITSRSVVMKLAKNCIGTLNLKRVHVDEDLTDEEVIAKSYPIGSEHKVRILLYHLADYRYSVSDSPEVLKEKYFTIDTLSVGDMVDAVVAEVKENSIALKVGRVNGVVPQAHMFDSGIFVDPKKPSSSKLSRKKYKVDQPVQARILAVDKPRNLLLLTLKPTLLSPDLEILKEYGEALIGKAYTGIINHVAPDYVIVSFFNNVAAYVKKEYVTKEDIENLNSAFHRGQIVNCTILRVDPEKKKMSGSLTTTPFWPEKKREIINNENHSKKRKVTDTDENEVEQEVKKKKKKQNADTTDENKTVSISKKKKDATKEIIEEVGTKKKKKKQESEEPKVSEESDAIETDIQDDQILTPQDLQLIDLSDCVTKKKYKKRVVSLLKSIQCRTRRLDIINKKIEEIEETGLDRSNKKYHTAMHAEKLVVEERMKRLLEALNEAQSKLKEFPEDEPIDYKRKKANESANIEITDNTSKKDSNDKVTKSNMKKKVTKDNKDDKEIQIKEKVKKIKVADSTKTALDVPSAKDFWSIDVKSLADKVQDEVESSSSEEEEQDQPKKKRKKLTAAEKVSKAREEEERLRQAEKAAIEGASQPNSVEQFERALLANPDSSQLWIAYMAFHLQATEIEKARAVGRKALTTISFREELEKLNVWLAMLNFEYRFGTKESQQKTLEEALQMNEPFKVHSKLLDIFVDTARQQDLVSLVDLMLRKYKRDPQMYVECGSACYKAGLVDKARQVMQKAISLLEKKEHVSVLVQFALMENGRGDRERAEALFEQILGIFPARVDVCSVYVDMLCKGGDQERVREVLERMTSQKLPARKMKILYKKWIEIEEKFGNKEQVERIRQKAMDYIEKAQF